jgi:hypothetical protein
MLLYWKHEVLRAHNVQKWVDSCKSSVTVYKEPLLKGFLSLQTTKRCARQERRRQKANALAQILLCQKGTALR